jgi:purine-nucleoside phosphorylase
MTTQAPHALDASVREAVLELESMNFTSPEVFLLLGTGSGDLTRLLEDPAEVSLSELPSCPKAWMGGSLCAGEIRGVRIWVLTDAPQTGDASWARAWPVWLSRTAGAGACLVTAAGCALPGHDDSELQDGYLFVSDHLALDGSSALRGLARSNLGPLFPDQGRVHDATSRAALVKEGERRGLACSEGILACTPGPALETPAERAYFAQAGAQASAQDLGAVFHAMAHSGLCGLTIVALLGDPEASVEELLEASTRLAPGLCELIEAAIDPLAERSRQELGEEL